MGQHRQRDVSIPGVVAANLVLVQTHLALGGLEGLLDRPAGTGHPDQLAQRGAFGAVTQVVGQIVRVGQAAPDQQPVAAASSRGRIAARAQ
jgi:hypothetical protein